MTCLMRSLLRIILLLGLLFTAACRPQTQEPQPPQDTITAWMVAIPAA